MAVALLLASVLLVVYYVVDLPAPDEYSTIYLLDTNGRAVNYPEYLVAGVNSTFTVYVNVENHMGQTLNSTVQVKVTASGNPSIPVDSTPTQTFSGQIQDGKAWQNEATVSLPTPGNYLVAFELWNINQNTTALQFSGNYCVLNVEVAADKTAAVVE